MIPTELQCSSSSATNSSAKEKDEQLIFHEASQVNPFPNSSSVGKKNWPSDLFYFSL